jgi:hypothetical protein
MGRQGKQETGRHKAGRLGSSKTGNLRGIQVQVGKSEGRTSKKYRILLLYYRRLGTAAATVQYLFPKQPGPLHPKNIVYTVRKIPVRGYLV